MPSTCDDKLEQEAVEWLELVSGEHFDSYKSFQENLKDGTILCKAFNGSFLDFKVKFTQSAMPFKQMENIATFLNALSKIPNFRSFDLFSTVDLFEGKNIPQVIRCILACKRFAEIEAKSKGIENLNNIDRSKNSNTQETIEKFEEMNISKTDSNIIENVEEEFEESPFENNNENNEANNQEESEDELDKSDDHENVEIEEEMIQPEVVLVENDDDQLEEEKDQEEYETFTTENPGTFEIQVSN